MAARSDAWTHDEVRALAASLTDMPAGEIDGYVVIAWRQGRTPAVAHDAKDAVSLINLLLAAVSAVAAAEITELPYIE